MTSTALHIPFLQKISDFYAMLRIGSAQSDQFSIMRIEEQPTTKLAHMPLFRCNFFRLVLFTSGGVDFYLGDQVLKSQENSLYFAYPGKLESWTSHQKVHGYLICFTAEFAGLDPLQMQFTEQFPFFHHEAEDLITFTAAEAQQIIPLAEQMLQEINGSFPDKWSMIRHLLYQYMILLRRSYHRQVEQQSGQQQQQRRLFNAFRRALDQYFVRLASGQHLPTPSVSTFAEELHLNASYLNTVIKKLTGATASSYIQQKTMLEAKSYLMHTDLRIAEVADRLGFTHISYFNRFFRQHAQLTPTQFRRQES